MQESGFTKSIPLICASANWGKFCDHEVAKSRTRLSDVTHSLTHSANWGTYSVFLHPEFPLGLPAYLEGFNH